MKYFYLINYYYYLFNSIQFIQSFNQNQLQFNLINFLKQLTLITLRVVFISL